MRIAIISQIFWPEKAAASNRLHRLAQHLAKDNEVTVLCGIPNYPTGVIYQGHRLRWKHKETHEGLTVIRSWVIPSPNKGKLKRILNYLSFLFSGIINGIIEIKKPQLIIASSPPLFSPLVGLILAKIKKAKFIFDARDLWPDSLVALKILNSRFILSFLYKLERYLYRQADRIIAVTGGMVEQLKKKGVPEDKIFLLTNTVDTDFFIPQKRNKREFSLPEDSIVALYAGNHSQAQNIRGLFEAAKISSKQKNKIFFLFIGEGEEKEFIENEAKKNSLSNVRFFNNQPVKKLIDFINVSDVCLVSLSAAPLFYSALPTKTLEFMSCAKPVIFFGDNFFAEIIEKENLGKKVSPNHSEQIPAKITEVSNKSEAIGRRARDFVINNYSNYIFMNNTDKLIRRI